jgi:hypothetical protein
MDELQEMREQMAALKEKLNKQEIVTEKLLKETIVGKMKRAKVWVLISVVILIIVGAIFLLLDYIWFENKSKAFSTSTLVFVLSGLPTIILGIVQFFKLKPKKIATATLGEVASQLQRTKEFEHGNFTFWMATIPSVIVLVYFVMVYVQSKSNLLLLCLGAYILLVIWGYGMRTKQKKSKRSAWDEYIRQIEEMSELDEENDKAESETKN